jgi:O-antigen chain-terminating methyltransferase
MQVREEEGLKGRIKCFLFKFIRFFAWWQEQINRALYQELMAQKAKMEERDRWVQELLHQQVNALRKELSERDKMVEDLNDRLILLSQIKDELSVELGEQRVKIGETESNLVGLLNQQSRHIRDELAKRDKVIEDLGNRLSLFGQVKDELYRELVGQKSKVDEMREWVQSLFNQQMDGIKSELAERDKVIADLNNGLIHVGRLEEELTGELIIQKEKLDEVKKETHNLFSQKLESLKLEFVEVYKNLNDEAMASVKKELSDLLEVKSAISHKQIKDILKEENHLPDALYVAFEDRFRGSREEVKERLRIYLPYVKEAKVGERSSPILDLGCGRGEWLELLKGNGYIAKGVDFNRVMVRQCQEFGLDVTESDMIEYLNNQPANSFGALTGFHILEHLSFKTLISLFDEALRVLKPGGMVIFETPNPENLIVAAYHFYFDPTHRNPLPPGLLNFLIESRGFGKTEIIRLHPLGFFREEQKIPAVGEPLISLFNKEQDYSVIAYKE